MNEANTQKLYADFPRLYHEAIAGERMRFGFECGDGWFNLVYQLSSDIESEACALGLDPDAWPMAIQVKEKFGTLSFYLSAGKRDIDGRGMVSSIRDLVTKAAKASATICEQCGCTGTLKRDGYWHTSCDECEAKH